MQAAAQPGIIVEAWHQCSRYLICRSPFRFTATPRLYTGRQSQPELKDDCGWAMLRHNDAVLMLNTAYEKAGRLASADPFRVAAHSDTSVYFGCPDVDTAYKYLLSKGVAVEKPVITGYGWKAIYISDPDGYSLSFHWPLK
jgi:uncharacterized glyoxalase superfamily protein PhnB